MDDIVNGLLLRQSRVLMVRRSAQRSTWPGCWSFPGGHVESGESLNQALIRELSEEIGIVPTGWTELAKLESRRQSKRFHVYLVTAWSGEPTLLGDEHSESCWIEPLQAAELPDLALDSYPSLFRTLATQLRAEG